ncbi:hypothetical protein JTE90_003765 [Oedothorax gibbosus]|uniref:Uncharacterized protein n=1 Tax=Oedothorax gibbosus TaxID=931172 RepID=A0AAV6TES0_9ARAC|nr:hypothetical protein JTE90_003765 [Oedothorax gibbosus]
MNPFRLTTTHGRTTFPAGGPLSRAATQTASSVRARRIVRPQDQTRSQTSLVSANTVERTVVQAAAPRERTTPPVETTLHPFGAWTHGTPLPCQVEGRTLHPGYRLHANQWIYFLYDG